MTRLLSNGFHRHNQTSKFSASTSRGGNASSVNKEEAATVVNAASCSKHIRYPEFGTGNITTWFDIFEIQMDLHDYLSGRTKLADLLSAIPTDITKQVLIKLKLGHADQYDQVMAAIIKLLQENDGDVVTRKVFQLTLGQKIPSSLFLVMKRIARGLVVESILFDMWVKKLPIQAQPLIADLMNKEDVEKTLELADLAVVSIKSSRDEVNAVLRDNQ